MGFEAIIPHMTSNNAPSPFIASTSNQLASYAPFYAFQDNGTAWISDVANSYVQIDLGRPYEVKKVYISSVSDWTGARMLTFTLQGSGDGVHWITLENTSTTSYVFTAEKNYGAFRYWRIISGSMTFRGGAISRFQLYQDDKGGLIDLKENDIWITEGKNVELEGTIYPSGDVELGVEINGEMVEEWTALTDETDVTLTYSPSDFEDGANIIKVMLKTPDGFIKTKEYVFYKLNMSKYGFAGASYPFKIKNSPTYPQNDAYIAQRYPMNYLNSEPGVSYMFKYRPYSQIDGRIENPIILSDKAQSKGAKHIHQIMYLDRTRESRGVLETSHVMATTREFLKAIRQDGYRAGFKEAGLIQQVFETWATIDKEDIGIVSEAVLSQKKDKAVKNMLEETKIPAYRKQEIHNALTLINGYIHGKRPDERGIIEYARLFQDVYPYKDTIIAMGLINAAETQKISVRDILRPIGYKEPHTVHNVLTTQFGDKYDGIGVTGEYINGARVYKNESSIMDNALVSSKLELKANDISKFVYLAGTEEGQAILNDLLLVDKNMSKYGYSDSVLYIDKDMRTKNVRVIELIGLHKDLREKHGTVNDVMFIDNMEKNVRIIQSQVNVGLMESEAMQQPDLTYVNPMGLDAWNYDDNIVKLNKMEKDGDEYQNGIILISKTGKDAWNIVSDPIYVWKLPKDANNLDSNIEYVSLVGIDAWLDINRDGFYLKQPKDAWNIDTTIIKVDKLPKDMRTDDVFFAIEKDIRTKEGMPVFIHHYFDKMSRDLMVIENDFFTDKIEAEALSYSDTLSFVDKGTKEMFLMEIDQVFEKSAREVFKVELLTNFNALEKGAIVLENWHLLTQVNREAKSLEDSAVLFIKEERRANAEMTDLAIREKKDTYLMEQLMLDYTSLDGYIKEMTNSFERIDEFDTVKIEQILSDKATATGFINECIQAKRENIEKEAIVVQDFVLSGDISEWEDIYSRYSPGVDVLDPPDADYDYEKLRPLVYEPATGKPINPMGPTNEASVYVSMPLSHPIPDNSEFGVDDTKRIAVDNYIFIDSVLALESIKNRNKLRYAGMPAGKTIREVFSQLFTWIQQAAPGHEEYERMFRFMRWYAEAVSIRQSKFLLERVYNPWKSSLHNGSGLGTTHTKAGWMYNTVDGTMDTIAPSAHLQFDMEMMIDGEFILRGYFDNPLSQGTIEISVDGVVVDSFNTHGVFQRKVEVAQGAHTFKVSFVGIHESVSISTIEITGVHFVSATTVTDDSDTNGLKALTELMSQLLGYFELHHGGKKVKGTMEIRQRAVWNTHT